MKTIYNFSNATSEPCIKFLPIWDDLKSEYPKIEWEYVDVETKEGMDKAMSMGVGNIPTMISSDGFRHIGIITKEDFLAKFLKTESGSWSGIKYF